MAEYGCSPLWEASPGLVGNVDPNELPISNSLKGDLIYWAGLYDKTLNHDDPLSSGFNSDDEEMEFKSKGRVLGKMLQKELGSSFLVIVKV